MPRFPFTPQVLDSLPEELAELFRGLEMDLLQQICSRLNAADQLNEVTVDAIRALRSHGIDLKDIEKAIRKTTKISQKKLKKLLDDVVARNQRYYTELIDIAQVTAPAALVDQEDIWAIYEQTRGELRNITRSMGFMVRVGRHWTMLPPAQAYQYALDSALLKVQSGAVSYNEAIRGAVRELADSGLKIVDYASGHRDQVDVATRRAVMTGVNQINAKYREQSMDYLETDLVEVSAHLGARNIPGPNGWEAHTEWQGKVFRWKGHGKQAEEPQDEPQKPPKSTAITMPQTLETLAQRRMEPKYEDITGKWYPDATPGSHKVEDAQEVTVNGVTYKVDGHDVQLKYSPHEKEIAELLEKEVGGEIKMLPKINQPQRVRTPDYLFHGIGYDLRTIGGAGKNTLYDGVNSKKGQAENFILDLSNSPLSEKEIERQISVIYSSDHTRFVNEIVIIKGDKIYKVYERKK